MLLQTAVRRFQEGYFSTCERSKKTEAAYAIDLRQFCSFAGPRRKITLLSSRDIESWANALRRLGNKSATVRRKLACLRVFFAYLVRDERIEHSPFWRVHLSLRSSPQLPRCITEQEIGALLGEARKQAPWPPKDCVHVMGPAYRSLRNLALVDLLFATGLRVGEVTSIDIDDFIVSERSLKVHGKGNRMRLAFLTDSLTVKIQLAHLDSRVSLGQNENALFLNKFGRRLSSQGVADVVSRLARDAGLRHRVTPHMLRHTVATLLLRNGVDLRLVQVFLGHSSITTTQRYTHVAQEHLLSALRDRHPSRWLRKGRTLSK